MQLCENARNAFKQGVSFDTWQNRESQTLLDAVTERDLNAIFYMVWKKRR